MKLTILGSSSATPYLDRHPSSQLLSVNDQLYLIDCGEGTLFRLNEFRIKKNKIKAIFISHLHGDHYYGLIGLLTTMSMHEKMDTLHIVCPRGLREIIELQCSLSKTILRFPIEYIEFEHNHTAIYKDSNVEVFTIPLVHKIDTCGFRFNKIFPERKIIKQRIEEYGLTANEIAEIVHKGQIEKVDRTITYKDISEVNTQQKSYAYCSDTRFDNSYLPYIQNLNVLYHESTFLHSDIHRAIDTKHSTAIEAAQIAVDAQAQRLLIGHFSARYVDLLPLLDEARTIFANTDLAIEGLTFDI